MQFPISISILTLALATLIHAETNGVCQNDNGKGALLPDNKAGQDACTFYKNWVIPNKCADCYWRDDANVSGEERCHSNNGEIHPDQWTALCQRFGAQGGRTNNGS
ncbi:hypothetical protein HYFRA_00001071 [Hymenoscyphus fraxineus]|uniref:Uncharacterized protein n=1 Tax=Hymenoscyphus fraxineus TaxID=746836 RepID=A0A9N9PMG3_9HELO|nr:hypothetical protein HYFRA_00001071 [Hymenoscyphus fraxineus]